MARKAGHPRYQPTHLRAWREYRNLTLEGLADRVEMDPGHLSRLERGYVAYSQERLEALAEALRCSVADIITRDPKDADAPWSIWEQIPQTQREQAVRILSALIPEKKSDAA
jgi:transcriptional regulator with XRE-family HTH domain